MDVAAELISHGVAGGGTVVVTAHQSAGRGTHGREWFDEPGGALLATMIVDDARVDSLLPLRVGLALCDLLESLGIADARIKWPNDCMCDNAKIGGILTRLESPHALIGVGLNVTSAPAAGATSVAAELARRAPGGRPDSAATITPDAVLEPFLAAFCRRIDATEIGRDCGARLWGLGRTVHIERPGGDTITGTIAGVSGDGALNISRNDKEEPIYAGRIRM